MRRGLTTLILLAFVAVTVSAVEARQRSASSRRAQKLYKAGEQAYAEQRFDEAAQHFSEGYMLDPKPDILRNIAQSYRKAAAAKEALHYYKEYLKAAPETKLRPQVEGLIKELEQEIAAQTKKPTPSPAPDQAVTPTPLPPAPAAAPAPFYKRWWFWTGVAVVVGAGIGVGVYVGNREPDYVKEGGLGSVSW